MTEYLVACLSIKISQVLESHCRNTSFLVIFFFELWEFMPLKPKYVICLYKHSNVSTGNETSHIMEIISILFHILTVLYTYFLPTLFIHLMFLHPNWFIYVATFPQLFPSGAFRPIVLLLVNLTYSWPDKMERKRLLQRESKILVTLPHTLSTFWNWFD